MALVSDLTWHLDTCNGFPVSFRPARIAQDLSSLSFRTVLIETLPSEKSGPIIILVARRRLL